MGPYFRHATEMVALRAAWHRIRANGLASSASETRKSIDLFERDAERNLIKIQRRLRDNSFEFEPQKGVLKQKSSGGKRGIVMAAVHNRIVERSLLDCLQIKSEFVQSVNNTPTSVGGVPHRSVPHGLKLISEAFQIGCRSFVRSDISGFFDHIPRQLVISRIADDVDDKQFIKLLSDATKVTLINESELGEDRVAFPTDEEGVAQGSPLSTLFGNILLHDFDQRFNGRGVVCLRFIDDFVMLANTESKVNTAFKKAILTLQELGLGCHDPFLDSSDAYKASHGHADSGFIFLGYDIRPGLFQPSLMARKSLEKKIDDHLRFGRSTIIGIRNRKEGLRGRQRYAQTLVTIDKVIKGWGEAFAYGNAPTTIESLDICITQKLDVFRSWFARQIQDEDWKSRRRLGGVCLLEDIQQKSLDDVPFTLEKNGRFVRSSKTITISTDGAISGQGRRRGKDQGPGGWAYVVHETDLEKAGRVLSATNNQMELRAVIEALKNVEGDRSIHIRTDSQYVSDAINSQTLLKTNAALWSEYQKLASGRRVKVTWIKGHAGDKNNERADALAKQQADLAGAEAMELNQSVVA